MFSYNTTSASIFFVMLKVLTVLAFTLVIKNHVAIEQLMNCKNKNMKDCLRSICTVHMKMAALRS